MSCSVVSWVSAKSTSSRPDIHMVSTSAHPAVGRALRLGSTVVVVVDETGRQEAASQSPDGHRQSGRGTPPRCWPGRSRWSRVSPPALGRRWAGGHDGRAGHGLAGGPVRAQGVGPGQCQRQLEDWVGDGQPQEPRQRGGGGRLPHWHSPLRGQQGQGIIKNN